MKFNTSGKKPNKRTDFLAKKMRNEPRKPVQYYKSNVNIASMINDLLQIRECQSHFAACIQ